MQGPCFGWSSSPQTWSHIVVFDYTVVIAGPHTSGSCADKTNTYHRTLHKIVMSMYIHYYFYKIMYSMRNACIDAKAWAKKYVQQGHWVVRMYIVAWRPCVFDTIPLILLQTLLWARPPQLRCNLPPMISTVHACDCNSYCTFVHWWPLFSLTKPNSNSEVQWLRHTSRIVKRLPADSFSTSQQCWQPISSVFKQQRPWSRQRLSLIQIHHTRRWQ